MYKGRDLDGACLLHTTLNMSKPPLASFDPFATHPFTNNNVLSKDNNASPADPSKYPSPIPFSLTQQSSLHGATNKSPSSSNALSPLSPSPPPPALPRSIQAPQPKHRLPDSVFPSRNGPAKQRNPIFVPFQQDRSSPELEEILLRKQLTQVLGPTALGRDINGSSL
jgi:hypothetical protein